MKTKYLLLTICLLVSGLMSAQNNTFKSLFDKYENEDDVTVISISKAMFNLIPNNIKTTGNVDLSKIASKIESLLILASDKSLTKQKMYTEFKSLVEKNKNYEELMRIKDGNSNITFNIQKKGDKINEMIMVINGDDEFVAIQILGNFTVDDIKKISDNTQIQ